MCKLIYHSDPVEEVVEGLLALISFSDTIEDLFEVEQMLGVGDHLEYKDWERTFEVLSLLKSPYAVIYENLNSRWTAIENKYVAWNKKQEVCE